jgi:Protein of unknown function (DUF3300)
MSAPMEFASVPVPILSRPISAAFAAEVMTAVQTLRAEAKAKGNLKSTSQMTVVQQSPQVIVIQPNYSQSSLRRSPNAPCIDRALSDLYWQI